MHFYLFTTSDLKGGRSDHLERMIAALEQTLAVRPDLRVKLYLLMQNCSPAREAEMRASLPAWIEPLAIEGRMSLSAARNHLMRHAGITADGNAICAFPDDDSWYPAGFLDMLQARFAAEPDLDFWFCRYSSQPESPVGTEAVSPRLQQVISRASSNTIFVRQRIFPMLAPFDEELGVGARLNGGEDTDYAIRAFYAARKTLFVDRPLVGHRDPDPALRPKYFPGTTRAIGRQMTRSLPGFVAFARKMAVGAVLVARGNLKLGAYLSAFREAFR